MQTGINKVNNCIKNIYFTEILGAEMASKMESERRLIDNTGDQVIRKTLLAL